MVDKAGGRVAEKQTVSSPSANPDDSTGKLGVDARQTNIENTYKEYFYELSTSLRKFYGNGPPDPEDVAQDAFRRVLDRGNLGSIRNLKAFLWRTARNIIFKAHRDIEIRSRYDFEIEEILFGVSPESLPPERILLAKEQLQIVQATLEAMPKNRCRAMVLHRVHGLSLTEVARRLRLSNATVHEHLSRGAAEIAAALFDEHDDD